MIYFTDKFPPAVPCDSPRGGAHFTYTPTHPVSNLPCVDRGTKRLLQV